jgi:Neuraminidase (sialidase)
LNIVSGVNNGKWISNLSGIDNFTIGNLLIQSPYTIPYISGKIDEVRLYNRALSQSEINILYNTTK